MQKEFWFDVWQNNELGFDQKAVNPLLVSHIKSLNLATGDTVFVPLCGKSIDMIWLLKQGYKVVGVELSEAAIEQFFATLEVKAEIWNDRSFKRYSAYNIEILVGDYFQLSDDIVGPIDAIYDRASLVALPHDMRLAYCRHLMEVCDLAPQLLITFDYDQGLQEGPPFSISQNEVIQHYDAHYQVTLLDSVDVKGGLKGGCQADEQVWLLL
ncbi:thiopurine S-methyltransferase [Marinicella litoralis]|uniref:Thiopurine S-methyltransferase n=1 Tax=Marinicella litoralis TaxID=644220 RepID=A0A4R6XZ06_9GAMM|nr:thiopurine S-methyltransferase [Marinicella litoralis]TDR23564.1 thiopurine S-methyltransferase [Marinicella litoralis]